LQEKNLGSILDTTEIDQMPLTFCKGGSIEVIARPYFTAKVNIGERFQSFPIFGQFFHVVSFVDPEFWSEVWDAGAPGGRPFCPEKLISLPTTASPNSALTAKAIEPAIGKARRSILQKQRPVWTDDSCRTIRKIGNSRGLWL
jgi:hypothetical protein